MLFLTLPVQAKYGGGSGTADDPYLIYTAEQMNAIGGNSDDWDKHFKLMADIDLSSYTGADFNIIGISNRNAFSGVFDGNGHTISNFSYNSSNKDYIGLFRYVSGRSAQIKDLGLITPIILAGTGSDVGSLAGDIYSGTITNCYVEGGSVAANKRIGGLVGYNQGILKDCSSSCSVSGNDEIGGLVSHNRFGEITNCYAKGEVFGLQNVGGLAGRNSGTIKTSFAACDVGGGGSTVGGLVGSNSGWISDCSAGGDIFGDLHVGGLVGSSNGSIINCYATGGVSGTTYVGGLVGLRGQGSMVLASFWDIETSGQFASDGGASKTTTEMQDPSTFIDMGWDFVGASDGPSDIWAEPDGGGYPVLWWQLLSPPELPAFSGGSGELDDPYLISTAAELNSIGHNPRLMSAHFKIINDIDLAGIDFFIIGSQWYPFGGTFDGNVYTISNFTYTSEYATYIGLFGYIVGGKIHDLGLINANVDVDQGDYHGGFAGYIERGVIANCYVQDGSISGNDYVGGLVGFNLDDMSNSGMITNCYVTGYVAGDDNVGGLIGTGNNISFGHGGRIGSRIERCYAAGRMSVDEYVGGLAGQNNGEIALSFWDNENIGQLSIADGNGRTTAQMQTAGTFLDAGWDFVGETENGTEDIWWIFEGQDYPRLWWESDKDGE